MFCENCGTRMSEDANVCEECGHVFKPENIGKTEEGTPIQPAGKGLTPERNASKKKIGLAVGAAAAVLAIIFLLVNVLPSAGAKGAPLLYVTSDGLYAMKATGKEPYHISEDAYTNAFINGREGVYITEDGTTMFYIDDWDTGSRTYNIYMRDLREEVPTGKDVDEKGRRVASNVSIATGGVFQVVEDGKYLVYLKDWRSGSGGKLYVNNLKEETRLDTDVSYCVSGDGMVVYHKYDDKTGERAAYMSTLEPEAKREKLGDGVSNFVISGKSIYYTTYYDEDGKSKMYMKQPGSDRVKLDEGKINDLLLTANGEIYYYKSAESGQTLYDLVNDDMAEQDRAVTEPEISDYRKEEYVNGYYRSYFTTVTDYDGYYEARDAYNEKYNRDRMRETLQELRPSGTLYSIYTIDKGKPVLITETASMVSTIEENGDTKGLAYLRAKAETFEKVADLSELRDAWDVYSYLEGEISRDFCVVLNGKSSVIQENTDIEHEWDVRLFGNTLACLDSGEEALFAADVSGSSVGTLQSVDYDVTMLGRQGENNRFHYYKQNSRDWSVGDLYEYKAGKSQKLAADIFLDSLVFLGDTGDFAYIADFNYNREEGTAYLMKGGKNKIRVGDDVHKIYALNDHLYFLQDFSTNSRKADLKKFIKEGTVELIDADVLKVLV